jgi:hypothetical protein
MFQKVVHTIPHQHRIIINLSCYTRELRCFRQLYTPYLINIYLKILDCLGVLPDCSLLPAFAHHTCSQDEFPLILLPGRFFVVLVVKGCRETGLIANSLHRCIEKAGRTRGFSALLNYFDLSSFSCELLQMIFFVGRNPD